MAAVPFGVLGDRAARGAQQVLAVGEVLVARDGAGWAVREISNQSAGYGPDLDSRPTVAIALDSLGLARTPGDFTDKIVFRRCPECGQLNIVRDGDSPARYAAAPCKRTGIQPCLNGRPLAESCRRLGAPRFRPLTEIGLRRSQADR